MKKIQISLNAMEAKVYELCKSATKGSDNGAMFCFDEVAVPAKKELGLSVEEVKGYLGSLKKKDAIRKLHESYYDFFVPEKCEDDYDWPYMDELYTVEITVEGAEKPAPSTKKIRIYQLNENAENARYMMFCGLDTLKRLGLRDKLSIDLYDMVWEGKIEDDADLDDIYTKFNINRPADFKGHSLSSSDIVEVDGKFFYCDSYGWEEVFSQPQNTITFAPEDVPQEELTGSCTPQHLAELRNVSDSCPSKKNLFDDIKKKHPLAILLFRCGDFYEAYEDDAKVCAKELGITLTKSRKDNIYMAGFPYHALDTYLPKLLRSGNKVAICDQL